MVDNSWFFLSDMSVTKFCFYHSKKSLRADRHRETFFKICVPYISDKPLKNTETVSGKFLKEPFLVAASEIITFIYQALFKVSFRFSFFLFASNQCIHFFNISLFLTFSLCQPLLKKSMEDKSLNFKVYNVINWRNKNCLTYCLIAWEGKKSDIQTWSIDRISNKEPLYGKSVQKTCTKKLLQNLFQFW